MTSIPIKYGDLFSGIGCAAQALKSLGIPFTYEFASDNDLHCKANLLHNFQVKQFHDDVRNITSLPKVDLFTAGFPCQPFSTTNKIGKKGLNHRSGDLFDETFRCLQLCNPEVFILENVAALTHKTHMAYFEHILLCLGALTDYEVKYAVMNSKDYGTPQSRPRIYFIGVKKREPVFPNLCPLDFTLQDVIDLDQPWAVDRSKAKVILDMRDKMTLDVPYIDNGQSTGRFTVLQPLSKMQWSYCLTATARCRIYFNGADGVLYSRRYTIDEMRQLQRIHPSFDNICSDAQFAKQIGNGMDVAMMAKLIQLNLQ